MDKEDNNIYSMLSPLVCRRRGKRRTNDISTLLYAANTEGGTIDTVLLNYEDGPGHAQRSATDVTVLLTRVIFHWNWPLTGTCLWDQANVYKYRALTVQRIHSYCELSYM